ncbi:MAG: diguanylate cyclase [Pseudomonadales bacterium]|nr:diguanylate cyclase [Pseudomonadales bacterium]
MPKKLSQPSYNQDWNTRLLQAVVEIQRAFIEESDVRESFDRMLACFLSLTDSGFGFIGEVKQSDQQQPYLLAHAITNIAWDEATNVLYQQSVANGFEFHNLNTLFGATLATGETIIANDPMQDPRAGGLPPGHPPLQSYMGIAIKHKACLIGMVGIANRDNGYDTQQLVHLEPLLMTAGALIQAVKVRNQTLVTSDQLQQNIQKLDAVLNSMSDALLITDYQGIVQEANQTAQDQFGFTMSELMGRHIDILLDTDSAQRFRHYLQQWIVKAEYEHQNKVLQLHIQPKNKPPIAVDFQMSEVKLGVRKLFVITLNDITERMRNEEQLILANQRLQALSITDELTRLDNRRSFDQRLQQAFNQIRQIPCPLCLCIIDIDYFKDYNDSYGHQQGDVCLQQLGRLLKKYFRRDCEFTARIGGEEFAVVMTHMPLAECEVSMQGFMQALRDLSIEHKASTVSDSVTISAGLAGVTGPQSNATNLFDSADKALYQAKKAGRNQLWVDKANNKKVKLEAVITPSK